jgi:hypothetical protein
MKFFSGVFLLSAFTHKALAFSSIQRANSQCRYVSPLFVTMAESGVPPIASAPSDVEDVDIPTNLPSDMGLDYVPLATMLASGQLAEADQVRIQVIITFQFEVIFSFNLVYDY